MAVPEYHNACDGFQGPSNEYRRDMGLSSIPNHTCVNVSILQKEDRNTQVD